jgi:transcriptional regulator with AAA-type ATPase domain/GGDEF domain-containing protein/HAMP domain-containing protein
MELAIPSLTPAVDGELADWPETMVRLRLDEAASVAEGREVWGGAEDSSAELRLASDANHLYLAGTLRDDQISDGLNLATFDRTDRLELLFAFPGDDGPVGPAEVQFLFMPWTEQRPWHWADPAKGPARPGGAQLTGVRVAVQRPDANTVRFEVAIPFHQFSSLVPGARRIGFQVVLRDIDGGQPDETVALSWQGVDPTTSLGVLDLPEPGPLVAATGTGPLLTEELLEDLPYLFVPLGTMAVLVLLLRGWARVRGRAQWLRPLLIGTGLLLFGLGIWLPSLLESMRGQQNRVRLTAAMETLQQTVGKLEQGTLASYRGPSRDRALMDLLAGKAIARQRYTSYRSLAQIAPTAFGLGTPTFEDMPVRPYWLPLPPGRAESFQFDPPLHGSQLHVVVGRSHASFSDSLRALQTARLRVELDYGSGATEVAEFELERPFTNAGVLGRPLAHATVVPVPLERDLRALTVSAVRGGELLLVGLSLEASRTGQVEPLLLGTPSLDGVLTDLRGPYPLEAGIELAPGATTKVEVPAAGEAPQKLWFFYRAVYPGLPTANPGARVAEIVLHFHGGVPSRTIVLEHQVSVFYELAVQNTRNGPPEGSPAAIALTWVDERQEKHVNLVYPVTDLPAGAHLQAIEFRNLAEYRLRFRSVVFGNERAAAPQDPVDAPLLRDGQERRLRGDVLERLGDVSTLVYRDGRLSEATLPPEQRQDLVALPRGAAGVVPPATEVQLADGGRRLLAYAALGGDGWDGAVLGVTSTDGAWSAERESYHQLGFLLCLLGTPLLLVLLSELLTVLANLRFRLMAVMSVASLVPLGLLSFVLVQVLESGHEGEVEDGMLATVRSAVGQLEDQKQRVQASARSWLEALAALLVGRVEKVPEAQFAKAAPTVAAELQKLLAGQLPPEWGGGFLRLEWQPELGAVRADPRVSVAGDVRMANVETPARLDPGVFMQWGVLMLGVRAEQTVRGGTLSLTAGRPLDGALLGALAPRQVVLLTDARGYPLAASDGREPATALLAHALQPQVMAQRERALATALEQRAPVVERLRSSVGSWVYGHEVLRDLQDTPRALLVVAQPHVRATLDLAIGRVPVRGFFLLVAGSLVVLSTFLSFDVSSRISRPIERLELGAQALSRGALETRVVVEEGGQIGRLTRTFNQMAADLQGRLQDLQALNRTMRELAAQSDEATTIDVLRDFCSGHTAADSVRIVLADAKGAGPWCHAGGEPQRLALAADGALFARTVGAFSSAARRGALPEPWSTVSPGSRSVIGLPIQFGGRVRGVVLLGFERLEPLAVDLDLLSTVVAQAAIALERAQLHRHAVQDPVTGALTPEYFRRRTEDEVSVAQQRGRPLAVAAVTLGDGQRRPRGLRRFAGVLRDCLPADAILCHAGGGYFQAVLPGCQRAEALASLDRIAAMWQDLVQKLPENEVEEARPAGVVVQFPDDAPSTEFLFDALRERLAALRTPGASAMESDESLQRAGVTAVSPAMRDVYGALRRVAPTDLPILLEGETGVGKEVLTNLVHRWSRRAGRPLVKVHCAALSETLLASELFGHEKGAFTGADRRKIGRFEQADGGTLFLDEVGDIPLDVQVKLLRVLQEGEIDRVGGSEPVRVDVRVIAATNRDIARMVADGRFREDLYYRLQGLVVRVPALRERKQELAGLVDLFRQELVAAGQSQARTLSTDAMDELYRRDWPGNIRELRNTVFRAMVLARGDVVQRRDVLAALTGSAAGAAAPLAIGDARESESAGEVPRGFVPTGGSAGNELPPPMLPAPQTAAPPAAPAPQGARRADGPEPIVTLPLPSPPPSGGSGEPLPPRLLSLLRWIEQKGSVTTQEHMQASGVSHRTGLRDLQELVRLGHIARVGTRRGAFYRPIPGSSLASAPSQTPPST